MKNTLQNLLALVAAFSLLLVSAAPLDSSVEATLDKRASTPGKVNVCKVAGSTIGPGTNATIGAAIQAQLSSTGTKSPTGAPWYPNCASLPNIKDIATCSACQALAGDVLKKALAACVPDSVDCAELTPICVTACAAFFWYAFYSAIQKCYCLHADCSNKAANAKALIHPQAPQLKVNNLVFSVQLATGGTVPPTVDYQIQNNNKATWKAMPVCAASIKSLTHPAGYGIMPYPLSATS